MSTNKDQFTLSFYGFVRGRALAGHADAKRVVGYGGAGAYTLHRMTERILAALNAGKIDSEWYIVLDETLASLYAAYTRSGQTVDVRDPREWESVGSGYRRRDMRPTDEADYEAAQVRGGDAP
jgi:hypothetical protein